MATPATLRYPPADSSRSITDPGMTGEQLRDLLEDLIASSRDLTLRLWLDGVYTDIDTTEVNANWINGREVYFKVEGRVDRMKREDGR